MNRFEKVWESFNREVLPEGTSPERVKTAKTIFYAGAWGLLAEIMDMLDPGKEPTENDLNKMSELHDELENHLITKFGEGKFAVVDGIMRKAGNA